MGGDSSSEDAITGVVTTPEMDPLIGEVLDGRFKVVEPIGIGGMGRVYRAVQQPLNRAVAVKVLDYNYGAGRDEAFRQRFLVEAALTAKLSHPNTITVIDYGCTPKGIFYIAMEYLDGRTLDQVVRQEGPLPWRRVIQIGQQVARSLREAHNLGVVHRDLKPGNVMLLHADDDADQVKVLDFGLVKSFVVGQELEGRAITQQGMLMGSPPYMAPEQGEKNHADPRSDIYSLGTVLYEALTGAPPFTGKSAMEVILKHVHQPVPPMRLSDVLEPVPAEMEALVARCLEKSPMDRFQSMDEVLQTMQELAKPTGGVPVQAEPSKTRLIPAVLFAIALLMGAAAATVIIRSLRPSDAVPRLVGTRQPDTAPVEALEGQNELPEEPVVKPVNRKVKPPKSVESTHVETRNTETRNTETRNTEARNTEAQKPPETVLARVDVPKPGARVTFHVETEPRGATVVFEGKVVGKTPVDVQVPVAASGIANAEFALSLTGYQPTSYSASGERGRVLVHEKLRAVNAKPIAGPPSEQPTPVRKKSAKKSTTGKLDDDDDGPPKPGAGDLKSPLLPRSN